MTEEKKTIDILKDLKFSIPLEQLTVDTRDPCPKCGNNKKLYCPECLEIVCPRVFPATKVTLPFRIHIIIHPGEGRRKATSLHAPLLCSPGSVSVYTYPTLPACVTTSPRTTMMSYPSATSQLMSTMPDLASFNDVVFIDSTWQQSYSISHNAHVMALSAVRMNSYKTLFWRFQDKDEKHLATIEAMYYFLVEHYEGLTKSPYDGRYDDLLLLFMHQYHTIQNYYKADPEKRTFTKRHREGKDYIKKDEPPQEKLTEN